MKVLEHEHRRIQALFDSFEENETLSEQKETLDALLEEIRRHLQLEGDVFYPALVNTPLAIPWIEQAEESRLDLEAVLQDFISIKLRDPLFIDKFAELEDKVRLHIDDQETELFGQIDVAGLDVESLEKKLRSSVQGVMKPKA